MEDDDHTIMPTGSGSADPDATRIQAASAPVPVGLAPSASEGEFLPAGYRLQEFEVQARLGQGGFCIVYKAWDHQLKRTVALKEYMPITMARRLPDCHVAIQSERHRETFDIGRRSFIEEAITLARFDHPALVRVYRNFESNGTAYMVMQVVQGTTLEEVVQAMPGPPSEQWLMDLLDPLTAALQIVHAERIVHRDIAPDNVMILAGSQRPLLLDFGAARQVIGDGTKNPTAMLKPSYAPIEQYPESGLPQGAHTDIYALAGVIHRLLTGAAPPNSQSRVLRDSYQPLATRLAGKYSPRLLKAVDHALALKPENRTATVEVFRRELGLDARQPRPAHPGRDAAPAGRSFGLWAAAGGVAVLGVMAAGLYAWVSSPSDLKVASPAPVEAEPTGQTASAPAPVPMPAPAPAQLPLSPDDAFNRIAQGASPDFRVSLTVESPQLKVEVTSLRIRIQSSQAGHYYVLLHDTDGEVRLLFPNANNARNSIAVGQTITLPPRGPVEVEDLTWAGLGTARLLAIVSATPLDMTAATKDPNEVYRVLLKDMEGARLQAQSPGREIYLGRAICAPGARCDERYGAADGRFSVVP
ncbi:MAG: protein kinase [Rubrivivax sp.]|nr:protein kinase [Rubrivivax sp.]